MFLCMPNRIVVTNSVCYILSSWQVQVSRYPLTSIEDIIYNEAEDPTTFRLKFSKFVMILQAESQDDARDWVTRISDGRKAF